MESVYLSYIEENDFEDYKRHIKSDVSFDFYRDFLSKLGPNHQIVLLKKNGKIIASGTLFIEQKLTYGGCKLGHIENIYVEEEHRSNGYAKTIINKLIEMANTNKCYRIDLICDEKLIDFYRKRGFDLSADQNAMSIWFPHNYNNI